MEQKITKFEAAQSQLITAIDLYFKGGDPVSIHTLARAAHEILDMLCKHRNLRRSVLHNGLIEVVRPELRKTVLEKINGARNFFKHANRDPEEIAVWNPEISEYFIWDATSLYRNLTGGKMPCEILVFSGIFRVKHSELWSEKSEIDNMIPLAKLELSNLNLSEIYEELKRKFKDGAPGNDQTISR